VRLGCEFVIARDDACAISRGPQVRLIAAKFSLVPSG